MFTSMIGSKHPVATIVSATYVKQLNNLKKSSMTLCIMCFYLFAFDPVVSSQFVHAITEQVSYCVAMIRY